MCSVDAPRDDQSWSRLESVYLGFFHFALQLSHRLQVFGDVHTVKEPEVSIAS